MILIGIILAITNGVVADHFGLTIFQNLILNVLIVSAVVTMQVGFILS